MSVSQSQYISVVDPCRFSKGKPRRAYQGIKGSRGIAIEGRHGAKKPSFFAHFVQNRGAKVTDLNGNLPVSKADCFSQP